MKKIIYRIAEINLQLELPNFLDEDTCLRSFFSFKALSLQENKADIQVSLVNQPAPSVIGERKLLSNISLVWDDRFSFEESEACYISTIRSSKDRSASWVMHSSKDFKQSTIYAVGEAIQDDGVLNWLLMMVFGQVALSYDTVMIHASVIAVKNKGYAFLGKSGTGKSTHSRLWLQHIPEAELLNDDNPAIRVYPSGEVYIFGTPWSGKTACYRNTKVQLAGLVRLEQAKENSWTNFTGASKLIQILPSCSAIRWNKDLFNQMLRITQRIVEVVPIGYLKNLPIKEAAELCYQEINKKQY